MTGFVGACKLGPILYYGIVRGKLTASNFGVLFCVCTTSAILCAPFSPLLPVAVMPAVLAIGCLLKGWGESFLKTLKILGRNVETAIAVQIDRINLEHYKLK